MLIAIESKVTLQEHFKGKIYFYEVIFTNSNLRYTFIEILNVRNKKQSFFN